jgi:hypothetical protein
MKFESEEIVTHDREVSVSQRIRLNIRPNWLLSVFDGKYGLDIATQTFVWISGI